MSVWLEATNTSAGIGCLLDSRQTVSKEQRTGLRGVQKAVALTLKEEGKTRPQVARLLGMDQSTISKWLQGTNMKDHNSCLLDSRQTVSDRHQHSSCSRSKR